MNNSCLRIIGDVHGKYNLYVKTAKEAKYSIQLGDLGFDYDWIDFFLSYDAHKILGGNHDNYTSIDGKFVKQTPHFLGDFGIYSVPEFGDIFYVRGGYSIDKNFRKEGVNWWPLEEITYAQGLQALDLYEQVKPKLVISHECPTSLLGYVGMSSQDVELWGIKPSMTANLLQSMFDLHQPLIWCHGHHHKSKFIVKEKTTFISLGELAFVDLPKDLFVDFNTSSLYISDRGKKIFK